jgi:membrane-bound lytic murein transglycosylase D
MKWLKHSTLMILIFSSFLRAEVLSTDEAKDQNEFIDAPEDVTPKISNETLSWRAPDYSGQKNALGWSAEVFVPAPAMKARVDFWVDIYAKYTTNQGVLHDAYYVDFVYDQIDFASIRNNKSLSSRQQKREIENLIKVKRHLIQDRLIKLSKLNTGDGLSGEDLRYWNMFSRLRDKNRFTDAADQSRIRFQLGQSDRFFLGIFYSGRYLKQMEAIFKDEGMPIELTRLPFVESSFNIFARSKVGASGVWQFMRRTAKLYMKVNNNVDERNDPLRAARSAARMLRQNYQFLGNWPLAITGWNHGPTGVHKIVKKLGTTDLSKIVSTYSSGRFGFASENFYASFLAALYVEAHADKYFSNIKWSRALENEEVKLTRALPFASLRLFFDDDLDRTLLLNPQFQPPVRKGRTPIPAGNFVHIPKDRLEIMKKYLGENLSTSELAKQLTQAPKESKEMPSMAIVAAPTPQVKPAELKPIEAKVAEMKVASTPVSNLASNLASANLTPPITEQTKLASSPTPAPLILPSLAPIAMNIASEEPPSKYKVKRGDSLTRISKRLHIKLSQLEESNPEMSEAKLMPGQILNLPAKN